MSANGQMIEVSGVTKRFGGVVANHEISLNVPEGRITGLIGPNGSGKTTLFNSVVGHHPIDGGSIKFEGQEISKLRVQQIARLGLLRTFQQTRIYAKMNCVQNMLVSIPQRGMGFAEEVDPELQGRAPHSGPGFATPLGSTGDHQCPRLSNCALGGGVVDVG